MSVIGRKSCKFLLVSILFGLRIESGFHLFVCHGIVFTFSFQLSTRMHSSRMYTTRFGSHHYMSVPGGNAIPHSLEGDPLERTWDQTGNDIIPPVKNMVPDRKCHRTPCKQTNMTKNITFSQLLWRVVMNISKNIEIDEH